MTRLLHPQISSSCMQGGPGVSGAEELAEVKKLLQNEIDLRKAAEEEVDYLRNQLQQFTQPEV